MFQDLVDKKLVIEKRHGKFRVFKYARKVFFANLWNTDQRLADARGMVLDDDDNIVQMPFRKIWNLFENGTKVERDRQVQAITKINGFLGVATLHEGELLVSTTGSTEGTYADIARRQLDTPEIRSMLESNPRHSFMFEIVDEADEILHPIKETPGAYLIGAREKKLGSPLESEATLDVIADTVGLKRPDVMVAEFDAVRRLAAKVLHEGFVIRDASTGEVLCKLKSQHYLVKKALMRLTEKNTDFLWKDPDLFKRTRVEEEQFELIDSLVASFTADQWKQLDEASRATFVEQHFLKEAARG